MLNPMLVGLFLLGMTQPYFVPTDDRIFGTADPLTHAEDSRDARGHAVDTMRRALRDGKGPFH